MSILTMVPRALAKAGYRFRFMGPNQGDECEGCPLQKLCFGLEPGRQYEVVGTRPVEHPCNLHDEGRVGVVEVKPTNVHTTVQASQLRGTAVTYVPVECGKPECPNNALCHPYGHPVGQKHAIVKVGDKVDCPEDFDLRQVELEPAE